MITPAATIKDAHGLKFIMLAWLNYQELGRLAPRKLESISLSTNVSDSAQARPMKKVQYVDMTQLWHLRVHLLRQ